MKKVISIVAVLMLVGSVAMAETATEKAYADLEIERKEKVATIIKDLLKDKDSAEFKLEVVSNKLADIEAMGTNYLEILRKYKDEDANSNYLTYTTGNNFIVGQ